MTTLISNTFAFLIFPGFVFTVVLGLAATWIVRKVTALIHHRIGPPPLQPLYDVVKLLGKETLIPEAAQKAVFVASPMVGFSAVLLLSTMLFQACLSPANPFIGDAIVAIYLMVIPSLALLLAGSSSASPHAAIGASREMKLVISYELPLVLAFVIVLIKAGAKLQPGQMLSLSALAQNVPLMSISGFLAFAAALLCIQAKLGFVPFDIAEAETELAGGVLIEYSGALLALWKLTQTIMLVALPMFLVILFLGGFSAAPKGLLAGFLKYVIVLVLLILIKNTNPRVRIDQAMKFFWFYCGPVLAIAVVLAMVGSYFDLSWL